MSSRSVPALHQHEAERGDRDRAEGPDQAERVDRAGGADDEQGDAHETDHGGADAGGCPAARLMIPQASAITARGETAWIVAARPPGRW